MISAGAESDGSLGGGPLRTTTWKILQIVDGTTPANVRAQRDVAHTLVLVVPDVLVLGEVLNEQPDVAKVVRRAEPGADGAVCTALVKTAGAGAVVGAFGFWLTR